MWGAAAYAVLFFWKYKNLEIVLLIEKNKCLKQDVTGKRIIL